VSDRIIALYEGEYRGEFSGDTLTEDHLVQAITG